MPDENDALVSENQRLRKANPWWKAIAIGALVLMFVVMLPFTGALRQTQFFRGFRETPESESAEKWREEWQRRAEYLDRIQKDSEKMRQNRSDASDVPHLISYLACPLSNCTAMSATLGHVVVPCRV